jgi:outer membrane lipoprotein-sorting protein
MKVYLIAIRLILGCSLMAPMLAAKADDKGERIIKQSDAATKSHTEFTNYEMDLVGSDGKVEQTRKLDVYFKKYTDKEVTLQKFLYPPIVQGAGLIIVDTGKSVNDIWMYLPTTRRLRRIAGAEKSNLYMGTEFAYEDFEDYQMRNHHFQFLREKPCLENSRCDLIESTPSTDEERQASSYSKKIYWVDKKSLNAVQVDYYDKQNHHVKTLKESNLKQYGHYWRPTKLVMTNLVNKRSTRIRVLQRKIDQPMDDYHLSKRFLRTD